MEIVVILDNIRSALNVGAILRTCDGLGVREIYLVGISPTPLHPKVSKTSLGAEEYVKWKHVKDISEAITKLKKDGYVIMAVEQTSTSLGIDEIASKEKVALIFGHEITGVSKEAIEQSDLQVEIPMLGKKNSFNVATTVGIVVSYFRFMKK